ncbi:hypothetical protein EVAR_81676_1 [Eumeta japonica]|uniref:Uncharacterized protein n=1 Tax=Eumeta variegata TaxID=151549 RepID=A0A4C1V3G3_EUMVA|nr:hypothetical protein EVAR_81676_1 [Eumeta japonica]
MLRWYACPQGRSAQMCTDARDTACEHSDKFSLVRAFFKLCHSSEYRPRIFKFTRLVRRRRSAPDVPAKRSYARMCLKNSLRRAELAANVRSRAGEKQESRTLTVKRQEKELTRANVQVQRPR